MAGRIHIVSNRAHYQMLRAVADLTRLRILNALTGNVELCVLDIVEQLQASQPKVSRHLAYLRSIGLVITRRQGLKIYYRLAPTIDKFHEKLMECVNSYFDELSKVTTKPDMLDRHVEQDSRGNT